MPLVCKDCRPLLGTFILKAFCEVAACFRRTFSGVTLDHDDSTQNHTDPRKLCLHQLLLVNMIKTTAII